jgi:hypothetical protein
LPLLSGDLINNNKENTDEDLPQPYVFGHRNDRRFPYRIGEQSRA